MVCFIASWGAHSRGSRRTRVAAAAQAPEAEGTKCGHVAIIGKSNVGKSTLMNAFVGEKIAIVTPKVQTTRNRIVGITAVDQTQVIFLDTPGVFDAKVRLDRAMVDAAWSSAAEADIIALMFDLAQFNGRGRVCDALHEEIKKQVLSIRRRSPKDVVMVMNKVDLIGREAREESTAVLEEFFEEIEPRDCVAVSATRGDGVEQLRGVFRDTLPEGPWLYPEDEMTTAPSRLMAAETTREKIFLQLQQELPYSVAIDTIAWEEYRNGSIRIDQEIYVVRQSQKGIIMGKGGARIKSIGMAARQDMEKLFGCKIHLFLHVKVRPDWQDRRDMYLPWGLKYNV